MKTERLLALCLATALGCSRKSDAVPAPPLAIPAPSTTGAEREIVLDWIGRFDDCSLGHYGALLDLGDPTMRARFGSRLQKSEVELVERDGATWARVRDRALALSFFSPEEVRAESGVVVQGRVRGGAARSVSVYLNGKVVGQWEIAKGESRVVSARAPSGSIAAGANEVLLRFNGGARSGGEAYAEVDWVHVGPNEFDATYAAPTRGDALTSTNLGGVAKRSISLHGPGFARCAGLIPPRAVLEASLGTTSGGEADIEVRLLKDRAAPAVLATFHLGASDPAAWKPISVPLGNVGTIAAVELSCVRASKGTRAIFGEPRVVAPGGDGAAAARMPRSRGVILVVLGTTSPRSIAPYGGTRPVPEISSLGKSGIVFLNHRVSTSLAQGSVATMLTGLSVSEHGVSDPDSRLARSLTTLADAARQGGVVAGMFTANPTTGAAFGFQRGWDTFTAHTSLEDVPAVRVFDDAAHWIDSHKADRFLAVIHARGGHPPWDATADEQKLLAPAGYTGGLEAKQAAELLAKARRLPAAIRFTDADRERAWALHAMAIDAHDAAIGRLMEALRAAGRDETTTVIVTSDAAVDEAAHFPFGDDSLDEASLSAPLIVRPPAGSTIPNARVSVATSGIDLARSVLEALGLDPPAQFHGTSLWASAARATDPPAMVRVASLGPRFSVRWGSFISSGSSDRDTKLCDLGLEPACVTDVRSTHPLAADVLHQVAFDRLVLAPAVAPREPAPIDPELAAALKAWGR